MGLLALVSVMSIWVLACAMLIANRADLIYAFRPGVDASRVVELPNGQITKVSAKDGTELTVWFVPPTRTGLVVLFFMGNAGHLPASATRLAQLVHQGHGVAALNYRGAGGAPGEPSEEAITEDAVVLYDALDAIMGDRIPVESRVIYGTSLGSAVSVQLAARRPSGGVVLGAPFARLCEAGQHHYPYIPVCWILPDNRWASIDRIAQIDAPLLILHGERDDVIPISQAEKLFDAAREPKSFIRYPEGRHADLRLYGSGIAIMEWLDETVLGN